MFALAVEVCFLPPQTPHPQPSPTSLLSRVVSRLQHSEVKHTERRESAKVNKCSCATRYQKRHSSKKSGWGEMSFPETNTPHVHSHSARVYLVSDPFELCKSLDEKVQGSLHKAATPPSLFLGWASELDWVPRTSICMTSNQHTIPHTHTLKGALGHRAVQQSASCCSKAAHTRGPIIYNIHLCVEWMYFI